MNLKITLLFVVYLFAINTFKAQTATYQISTLAFYNLENLFDADDDPFTYDEEYTPTGKKVWTEEKINLKLDKLSHVISQIGLQKTTQPPALIGLSEVENKNILLRLITHSNLSKIDYGIAHFNSPDKRGIDVALLYDRKRFKLTNSKKHVLFLKDEYGKRIYTRDQLCVSGFLGNDLIYCLVNHWPSRRGGEKRSRSKRIQAANQLIFSNSMLDSLGITLYQTHIFSPKYLLQKKGKYKGYPKRTSLTEIGYSDHFPVYSYLIKRID